VGEKSVLNLVYNMSQMPTVLESQSRAFADRSDEVARIYDMLNVRNREDAVAALAVLVLARQNPGPATTSTRKEEALGHEQECNAWELWAKRVHDVATDELSARTSARELRCAIEGAVMHAIGQRRIEILRTEKRLLTTRRAAVEARVRKAPTVNAVGLALTVVYRLQKLSGHVRAVPGYARGPLPRDGGA